MAQGTQVNKTRSRRPRFVSWLRPEGHVFNGQPWLKPIISCSVYYSNLYFSTKMSEIVELQCYGQLQTLFLGKMGSCYGLVAWQYTSIEALCSLIIRHMVAKEQQWLLGKYLKNALLLGWGCYRVVWHGTRNMAWANGHQHTIVC